MKIAVVGDYDHNRPSHLATSEAIEKSAIHFSQEVRVEWVPTRPFEIADKLALLQEFDGIWGAPGDHHSSLGYINAIRVAREAQIPYLGT